MAGSPETLGQIRFVILRTGRSPPVALHPASRRRSYSRLQAVAQTWRGLAPLCLHALTGAPFRRKPESRNPGCWIESSMTRQEPMRINDSHSVFIVKEWVQGVRSAISDSHSDKTFEERSIFSEKHPCSGEPRPASPQ